MADTQALREKFLEFLAAQSRIQRRLDAPGDTPVKLSIHFLQFNVTDFDSIKLIPISDLKPDGFINGIPDFSDNCQSGEVCDIAFKMAEIILN